MNTSLESKTQDSKQRTSHDESQSAISYPSRTIVRAKLEMTEPGDEDEQEADAVANTVVNGGKIAREISGGSGSSGIPVPRQMESRLMHSQGGGQPMPQGLRSMMEGAFGQSFSNVRLHTDSAAAEMSSSIGARAFTYGNDIFFNKGQYSPQSSSGQHLLAHELTHTLQQGGKVARRMSAEEKAERQEQILVNRAFLPDSELVAELVKYLCPRVDEVLISCYFDALIRAENWLDFRGGSWRGNLEAFDRTKDVDAIPEAFWSEDNYMKAIAKSHVQKLSAKMKANNGGRNFNPYSGLEAQIAAYDTIQSNNADPLLPPLIKAIENEYLWHIIKQNDPQQLKEDKWKKPDNWVDAWVFEVAFAGMLVTPFLIAGGIAASSAAGAYYASLQASQKLVRLFEFLNSPAGKLLVSTIKNGAKKGYDVFMDSEENRSKEGYARDQFIDLGADLFLDTLDVSILGSVDNEYVKIVFKDVVKSGFDTLYKATKGENPDISNVQSLVKSLVNDICKEKKIPLPVRKALVVSASTLLGWLFGAATSLRSLADYEKPLGIKKDGPMAGFIKEKGGDGAVFSGYLGLLETVRIHR